MTRGLNYLAELNLCKVYLFGPLTDGSTASLVRGLGEGGRVHGEI